MATLVLKAHTVSSSALWANAGQTLTPPSGLSSPTIVQIQPLACPPNPASPGPGQLPSADSVGNFLVLWSGT